MRTVTGVEGAGGGVVDEDGDVDVDRHLRREMVLSPLPTAKVRATVRRGRKRRRRTLKVRCKMRAPPKGVKKAPDNLVQVRPHRRPLPRRRRLPHEANTPNAKWKAMRGGLSIRVRMRKIQVSRSSAFVIPQSFRLF